ncbi:hypothetical protein L1049_007089 [Liquidambar formosana]|uniref:Uncharacterized protein n=1 Tax=Liquidambar formosana TaxID=63359 RepID=A0AAP0RGV9_LIQFO
MYVCFLCNPICLLDMKVVFISNTNRFSKCNSELVLFQLNGMITSFHARDGDSAYLGSSPCQTSLHKVVSTTNIERNPFCGGIQTLRLSIRTEEECAHMHLAYAKHEMRIYALNVKRAYH